MQVCLKCNNAFDNGAQFCDQCGDKLVDNSFDIYRCKKCYKYFINSEFCPNDGSSLNIYSRNLKENQIEIRNVEQYTVQIATEPMLLNMDEFINCEPSYAGADSNDFMTYLNENMFHDIESFIDVNESNLKDSTKDILWNLQDHPNGEDVIYDSRNKYGNMWHELGKTNPEYTKDGGFETLETTQHN
jgi:RNA polymerase subunit RPABC4/transcription elongation factor Spt4